MSANKYIPLHKTKGTDHIQNLVARVLSLHLGIIEIELLCRSQWLMTRGMSLHDVYAYVVLVSAPRTKTDGMQCQGELTSKVNIYANKRAFLWSAVGYNEF